jgi:Transposase DDE domain
MTATRTQVVKPLQQDWTGQLAPEAILTACRGVAYRWRERTRDPVTTLPVFFVQMLHGHTACTPLRHLPTLDVTASASCQARLRLPLAVCAPLLRSVSHAWHHQPLEEGRWVGHRTLWGDGSSFSMPATPALPKPCGQPGTQLPGGGVPVAHLLALWHAGPGLIVHIWAAPLRTHDLSAVVRLHPAWRSGAVLVADRGLCASAHLALRVHAGVQAVCRMPQKHSVDCPPGRSQVEPARRGKGQKGPPRSGWLQRLGEHDPLVQWLTPLTCPQWMEAEPCAHVPARLEGRARRSRQGCRVKRMTLVTTLLEAALSTVEACAQLSGARWGMETHVAHWNTTMGLDVLPCTTVDGVLTELSVFALMDHLSRLGMLQAARRQQVDLDRVRLIDAARWLAAARDNEPLSWLVVPPHRPARYAPRVRKRRPKPYPLRQTPRKELRKLWANNTDVD